MIKPDSTLLIQIQLALIGIVVVAGLFYLWRIITRLEERVEKSLCKCNSSEKYANSIQVGDAQTPFPFMMAPFQGENSEEELMHAEELMKQVFGGIGQVQMDNNEQPSMMMFSMETPHMNIPQQSSIIVEEITKETENNSDNDIPELIELPQENQNNLDNENNKNTESDSETNDDSISFDTNPMSKSKLSQMKLDKLRALCKARELSTEGLKPQLIERLLGLSRE